MLKNCQTQILQRKKKMGSAEIKILKYVRRNVKGSEGTDALRILLGFRAVTLKPLKLTILI